MYCTVRGPLFSFYIMWSNVIILHSVVLCIYCKVFGPLYALYSLWITVYIVESVGHYIHGTVCRHYIYCTVCGPPFF